MREPTHKRIVHRHLDLSRVEERLKQYQNIRTQYSIEDFRRCSDRGSYYCHYLAWRLGTWEDEEWFEFFDELLANGTSMCNWHSKKDLLKSCSFDSFWGLMWELQVAMFLSEMENCEVEWLKSGPDLRVVSEGDPFFVECYTYRKSFGIEEFVRELFHHIHPQIRTTHIPWIPFSLPKNLDTDAFLDELFRPYLDPGFLQSRVREAKREYPVLLPTPKGTENFGSGKF